VVPCSAQAAGPFLKHGPLRGKTLEVDSGVLLFPFPQVWCSVPLGIANQLDILPARSWGLARPAHARPDRRLRSHSDHPRRSDMLSPTSCQTLNASPASCSAEPRRWTPWCS